MQGALDEQKSQRERNELGQFATPGPLAQEILASARHYLGSRPVRFLDPAFGTGSFYSALLRVFPEDQVRSARGFEIDRHYGLPAHELWRSTGLDLAIADFTQATPPGDDEGLANLLVCNPPYVRHHHLDKALKRRLAAEVASQLGIRVSGLAGLYVYFMLICHRWLREDALSIWLVPSEFMDVNYGSALKDYLLETVELLRIHRFDPEDVQFGDALVSSAVIWFRKRPPVHSQQPEFTMGGSIHAPRMHRGISRATLVREPKWTRFPLATSATERSDVTLADLFTIKRGIATGANGFFLMDSTELRTLKIPSRFATPILPSPRHLENDVVHAGPDGVPTLDRILWLFDCRVPLRDLDLTERDTAAYIRRGEADGIHRRYLTSRRDPWYSQEEREPAPILCTYMGRSGPNEVPFRVILNHSRAIATNVYLMLYPRGPLKALMRREPEGRTMVWRALRETVAKTWSSSGRVYGGGLHKVEPSELGRLPAALILACVPELRGSMGPQLSLL